MTSKVLSSNMNHQETQKQDITSILSYDWKKDYTCKYTEIIWNIGWEGF